MHIGAPPPQTIAADRDYTVTLEAVDAVGNASRKEVVIRVPHDRGGGTVCGPVAADRIVSWDDARCRE
jgi:hypothetical protein